MAADPTNVFEEIDDIEDSESTQLQEVGLPNNDTDPRDGEDEEVRVQRPALPPVLAEAEAFRAREVLGTNDGGSSSKNKTGLSDTCENETDDRNGDRDNSEGGEGGTDPEFEQLRRLWVQELNCPELLPHDADTMALHMELLAGQEDAIDELRDPTAISTAGSDPGLASLAASIYRMDADRTRFLLADLTRTRLRKIEAYALHNREVLDRMSEEEIAYLQQYGELYEGHLRRTVLDHVPKDRYNKLDEPNMIDRPVFDCYVFCRILQTVEIDNNRGQEDTFGNVNSEDDDYGGGIQEHATGACLFVRYETIKELILQGKVSLLM